MTANETGDSVIVDTSVLIEVLENSPLGQTVREKILKNPVFNGSPDLQEISQGLIVCGPPAPLLFQAVDNLKQFRLYIIGNLNCCRHFAYPINIIDTMAFIINCLFNVI